MEVLLLLAGSPLHLPVLLHVDKDVGKTIVDAGFVSRVVGPLRCFCVYWDDD